MNPSDGKTWGDHFGALAAKYPTPSTVADLPLPPTIDEPPETWLEWAKAWKAYYDTTSPEDHEPPSDGSPPMPPPGSSNEDWKVWAEKISVFAGYMP